MKQRILAICVLVLVFQALTAQIKGDSTNNEINKTDTVDLEKEKVFVIIENMPKFQGQKSSTFEKYVQENIIYPEELSDERYAGMVYVEFVVTRKGNVANVKIFRGAGQYIDKEIVRVIDSSPRWEAGTQRGKPLNVKIMMRIAFSNY